MQELSLTNKTLKGVGWNTIDKLSNYGIGFIVSIVLARLLSPEEYGLIGIILIFTGVFNTILDGGLQTALIRKDKVTEEDYCTVFYTNIILSVIFTALLYLLAPQIAVFFERLELIPLIRAMSFILVINALSLTQQTKLTKHLDFKTQTIITLISCITSGIFGIVLAYLGFGVWALVCQQLSSRLLCSLCLWIHNKWFPSRFFSTTSFKELFGFSWKLLIARIIDSAWTQMYQAVVGKIYSPATLGQFTRARQYANLCSTSIGEVVLKVSLPVMSEIQNDSERLLRGYRRIIKITMFVTFIVIFCMIASSRTLILVLIGEKWIDCIPMMQIICLQVMLYPLHMININMLIVQGRSDIQLYIQIIKSILGTIPIVIGVYTNIYCMLIASVFVGFISFFINSYYSGKKLNYSSLDQLRDITPSLIFAFVVAFPVYLINFINISVYIQFLLQLIVGCLMIIVVGESTKITEYNEIKQIIMKAIQKYR